MNNNGFIKLIRSEETAELLREPNAFALLTIIALRAKRTISFSIHNLQTGQALIGDYFNYGLTRQQYRTALQKLEKWGFVTINTTSKGTITTLINKRIYDINQDDEQPIDQPTNNNQTTNKQPITKNERMKEINNISTCDDLFELFEQARRLYPGDKRGGQTEFDNLKRKHKDYKQIIPALEPAIQLQIINREKMKKAGDFVPPWKHFKTYINNRCWESKIG